MERMWINQPSKLQPLHKYHGERVLYDPETSRIYFVGGDVASMGIITNPLPLSPGWPTHA
jgi:hypothetical protein